MTFLKTLKPHLDSSKSWRKNAWETLEKKGLPTTRWEEFKYVSLNALWKTSFPLHVGTFPPIQGAISLPLEEGRKIYAPFFQKNLDKTMDVEISPFALLNEAISYEGQFIYVPPGKNVDWNWEASLAEGMRLPRLEIFVGKGAHLALVFRCQGKGVYFYNPYVQLTLEEEAQVDLKIECEHSAEAFAMHTIRAHLKKKASLNCFIFSKGAHCERHDLNISLNGKESTVNLKGLSLPSGKDAIHHSIKVMHRAPYTSSSQHFKAALSERAVSSFQGNIFVEKEAQKTNAYQLSRYLLLSDHAKAMSQPNLEIFADDVKASHGATLSQLKKEELFYLQTRGLPLKEAKEMLVEAFCNHWIDKKTICRFLKGRKEHAAF